MNDCTRIELIDVSGLGEVRPGDDLAALIADAAELMTGVVAGTPAAV